MSDAEQSEDGQVMSGVELSPSDDEETTDSLDIKPPQASSAYYGMSKRKDKKGKDRRHAKDQQHIRHHMMAERESDRDRERGDRRGERTSNRMEREQYYRERERDHAASGREQHRHSGQGSSSRTAGGSSGRDRTGGSSRDTSNRDKHHSSRYEMNPFYGELRETYHSKRERDRDREREHRGERAERDRDREREYSEKQRRAAEEKATDPEKIMEDLRTRLLHKKNRRDSKRGDGREREHREMHQEHDMHPEEAEYYAEKSRDHRRREQHPHRRHREEEDGNEVRERERDRTRHHGERRRAAEVVEILESPEHHHYQHHHHNHPAQQQQPSNVPRTAEEKEQDERRAKLLEADREMLRRKELAREELEARRLRKEEERGRGTETESHSDEESDEEEEDEEEDEDEDDGMEEEHQYEDDDVEMVPGDEERRSSGKRSTKRRADRGRERTRHRNRRASSHSPTSSSHGSLDSDAREDDEEHPPESPLSVGDLVKSDHRNSDSYHSQSRSRTHSHDGSESRSRSRSRSPRRNRRHDGRDSHSSRSSRSRSPRDADAKQKHPDDGDDNGNDERKASGEGEKPSADVAPEVEVKDTLPPYFPGIQGCRSVEEFLCLNRIEEGTYGVVYRAKDKRTEEIVALKRLKMEKEKEGFPITSLREINTLLKGQHPNIVTVREIVVGSNMDKIFIVMDYVEHDLKSLMETMKHKKQVFLPGEVKCLTQQLLRAVAHLHDNWILHRDLKTSNLLLSHKGILKVGDFGLAREYGSPLKPYTSIVVTLWYRAPELLLCCKEYSTPIDIWSVGCIFAEFLSMAALFPGKTEIDQLNRIFKDLGTPNEKIWPGYNELPAVQKMTFTEYPVSNLRKKFSHLTSELGISLLQGLLTFDPKQRLTAEVALQHNYFKELPLPIDPAMFPTWPAKSELGLKKALASSPKPPSGGGEFKKLGDDAVPDNAGFHLGGTTYAEARQLAMGPGFSLKF
uniref:cyclin-dependent kinase n=1 Tax=Anopheles culicifacies TaxID=139723 RepID=A0A182MNH0_9DIPT